MITAFVGPVYMGLGVSPDPTKTIFAKLRLRKSTLATLVILEGVGIVTEIATVRAAGVTIDTIGINLYTMN